jgi:hypothetical protein
VREPYEFVLAEHRRRLARVVEQRGVGRLRRLYDRSQQELLAKIARRAGSPRAEFTPTYHRAVLAQVRQGQALIAARMAGELGDVSKEAQVEALGGLAQDVRQLQRHFTGTTPVLSIDEAARFAGVIDANRTSLLRMHEVSMRTYGGSVVSAVEGELALSMAQAETLGEAIDRVHGAVGDEFWKAERIARTETSWAANATTHDGIVELQEDVPEIKMRWTEHVADDGTPLDERVAVDSLALHGQVVAPGGLFTCPPTTPSGEPVPHGLVGKQVSHPPLRPNDRATLAPWAPSWGAPGWLWRGGRRVPL